MKYLFILFFLNNFHIQGADKLPPTKANVIARAKALNLRPIFEQPGATPFPNPPKTSTTKQSCSFIDLTPQMGEVRDQIGASCYAYVATDLLQFGQAGGPYSALHLATQNQSLSEYGEEIKQGKKPRILNEEEVVKEYKAFGYGSPKEAMELGLNTGLCPEEDVYSDDRWIQSEGITKDVSQIFYYYQTLKNHIEALNCPLSTPNIFQNDIFKDFADIESDSTIQNNSQDPNYMKYQIISNASHKYSKLDSKIIEQILKKSTDAMSFLTQLNDIACKDSLQKIPPNKNSQNIVSTRAGLLTLEGDWIMFDDLRNTAIKNLNSHLSKGKPVGISYKTQGLIKPVSTSTTHGSHASSVAGRRWKPGKNGKPGECIYLVKNSWGTDWIPPNGAKASPSKYPGYFEITEKQLMEHMIEINYLE